MYTLRSRDTVCILYPTIYRNLSAPILLLYRLELGDITLVVIMAGRIEIRIKNDVFLSQDSDVSIPMARSRIVSTISRVFFLF